jgi:uncharacterized protein YceK
MRRAIAFGLAGALLTGCSTMNRISEGDWGMYSGTKASQESDNAVDTTFSAVGDTLLLPVTSIAYLFGYRFENEAATQAPPAQRSPSGAYAPGAPAPGMN